jgi:4-carboxymuconolactone decarboxylase
MSNQELLDLARLAAAVAAGDEMRCEETARALSRRVQRQVAEEIVLQTYLFAGFPAAINGFTALERVWPREEARGPREPVAGPPHDDAPPAAAPQARGEADADCRAWRERGELLCARIYGPWYSRLRARMRRLSPELDEWMVVEGYGKTLSRRGPGPAVRELCAVAALAALGAVRQLEAHLEGARRMGAAEELIITVAREAIRRHAPAARQVQLEALLSARAYGRTPLLGAPETQRTSSARVRRPGRVRRRQEQG